MGVEFHAVLEFYGITYDDARNLEGVLKSIATGAQLQGTYKSNSKLRSLAVPQRIHISLASESQEGAQARLQGVYKVLNMRGKDYEVIELWAHDGKEIAGVI